MAIERSAVIHDVTIQVAITCACGAPAVIVLTDLGCAERCDACGARYVVDRLAYARKEGEANNPLKIAIAPVERANPLRWMVPANQRPC